MQLIISPRMVYNKALQYANDLLGRYGANPKELAIHITGIAGVESSFNALAKNRGSSARGLVQILINTQRDIEKRIAGISHAKASLYSSKFPDAPFHECKGEDCFDVDKIYDWEYALYLGTVYLAYQFHRYDGDWAKAIHAYNQGSHPGTRVQDGISYLNKVQKQLKWLWEEPEFASINELKPIIERKTVPAAAVLLYESGTAKFLYQFI